MENITNETQRVMWNITPETSIYFVNLILCICLNILVLIIIHRQREIQEVMRLLHRILASTSIAYGFLWNLWSIVWFAPNDRYSCSVITCIFLFPTRVLIALMMACLTCINLNMYLLITKPMHYHMIVTPQRIRVALVILILTVLLITGCTFPVTNSPIIQNLIDQCLLKKTVYKNTAAEVLENLSLLFPIIVTFVLSSVVYIKLLMIARRQMKRVEVIEMQVSPGRPSDRSDLQDQPKKPGSPGRFKGVITVSLLSGSFMAVWIPVCMFYVIPGASSGITVNILDKLASTSGWVQPTVYLMTNEEARRICAGFIRKSQLQY